MFELLTHDLTSDLILKHTLWVKPGKSVYKGRHARLNSTNQHDISSSNFVYQLPISHTTLFVFTIVYDIVCLSWRAVYFLKITCVILSNK